MDTAHFFNLRSLAKRDLIITNLKIDIAELTASKNHKSEYTPEAVNVMIDLQIKKKHAELEIEIYERNEYALRYIKPSEHFVINDCVTQYYNEISRRSTTQG